LDALKKVDAERACLLFGNARIMAFESSNECIEGIYDEDKAAYKYIDFGKGVTQFTVRIAPGKGGRIELLIDQPWGATLGSIDIPAAKNGEKWENFTGKINNTKGVHALWLRFKVKDNDSFKVDWFSFGI